MNPKPTTSQIDALERDLCPLCTRYRENRPGPRACVFQYPHHARASKPALAWSWEGTAIRCLSFSARRPEARDAQSCRAPGRLFPRAGGR